MKAKLILLIVLFGLAPVAHGDPSDSSSTTTNEDDMSFMRDYDRIIASDDRQTKRQNEDPDGTNATPKKPNPVEVHYLHVKK